MCAKLHVFLTEYW